jgi:hypothetical protein
VLLGAILEDFSQVARPHARISRRSHTPSPAVACRAVEAAAFRDRDRDRVVPATADPDPAAESATPILIHGTAPAALAAWKSAIEPGQAHGGGPPGADRSRTGIYGIDIEPGLGRRGAEAAHSSLGMLADLPRTVPVTVGLSLGQGWRDTMALIRARGRGVRFQVYAADSPGRRTLAEAIRAAVAEGCAFSLSCAHWQPMTEPPLDAETGVGRDRDAADGRGSLPGILNILLATVRAVQGADSIAVVEELDRTDTVDVVDAVRELSPHTARRVRRLLRGFAVYRTAPALDALTDLGLLPKVLVPVSVTP